MPVLLPAAVASVAALCVVLAWRYLRRLPARLPLALAADKAPAPPTVAQRRVWATLGLVAALFLVGSVAALPWARR